MTMSSMFTSLSPLFANLSLVAVDASPEWSVIKRKDYLDCTIRGEPYSSVEVLYHNPTQRMLVRVWSKTVLRASGSNRLRSVVTRAFRYKPCIGVWRKRDYEGVLKDILDNMASADVPVKRYYARQCPGWTTTKYDDERDLGDPVTCQLCKAVTCMPEEDLREQDLEWEQEEQVAEVVSLDEMNRTATDPLHGELDGADLTESNLAEAIFVEDEEDHKQSHVDHGYGNGSGGGGRAPKRKMYSMKINELKKKIQMDSDVAACSKFQEPDDDDPDDDLDDDDDDFCPDAEEVAELDLKQELPAFNLDLQKVPQTEEEIDINDHPVVKRESEMEEDTEIVSEDTFSTPGNVYKQTTDSQKTFRRVLIDKDTLATALSSAAINKTNGAPTRQRILVLRKTADGRLNLADPSLLEGKTILIQRNVTAGGFNVPVTTQRIQVAGGEYRGHQRPFHDQEFWMHNHFPNKKTEPVCPVCNARFKELKSMRGHLKYFHAYAWYKCPVCLIWKNQPRDIVEHVIMEHPGQRNTTVLECANCQKGHPVDNFKKHALKCFKREIGIKLSLRRNDDKPTSSSGDPYASVAAAVPCQFCTKSFGSYPAYQAHLKSHEESLKCDEEGCDYVTHSVKYLKHHTDRHSHARGDTETMVTCEFCGKKLASIGSYKNHVKMMHYTEGNRIDFPCDQCEVTFWHKSRLQAHVATVHLKNQFPCEKCGKCFPLRGRLNSHIKKVHEGKEKIPMKCETCGRVLSCLGTYRNHLKIHTGEKPFKCDFCPTRFLSTQLMCVHRRENHPEEWAEMRKKQVDGGQFSRSRHDTLAGTSSATETAIDDDVEQTIQDILDMQQQGR